MISYWEPIQYLIKEIQIRDQLLGTNTLSDKGEPKRNLIRGDRRDECCNEKRTG